MVLSENAASKRKESEASHEGIKGIEAELVAIEDVGRHVVVRTRFQGQAVNVIVKEGQALPSSPRLHFAPEKLNVYQNSFRVESKSA